MIEKLSDNFDRLCHEGEYWAGHDELSSGIL